MDLPPPATVAEAVEAAETVAIKRYRQEWVARGGQAALVAGPGKQEGRGSRFRLWVPLPVGRAAAGLWS